jgi:hypothetical protein
VVPQHHHLLHPMSTCRLLPDKQKPLGKTTTRAAQLLNSSCTRWLLTTRSSEVSLMGRLKSQASTQYSACRDERHKRLRMHGELESTIHSGYTGISGTELILI